MGETSLLSTIAGSLAHLRFAARDDADAERFARTAAALAAEDDVESQASWRGALAIVLARRGDHAEAERLAMETLALVRPIEAPLMISDALVDVAEVLRLLGRSEEARPLVAEAVAILRAKGDVVTAERLNDSLAPTGAPLLTLAMTRPPKQVKPVAHCVEFKSRRRLAKVPWPSNEGPLIEAFCVGQFVPVASFARFTFWPTRK